MKNKDLMYLQSLMFLLNIEYLGKKVLYYYFTFKIYKSIINDIKYYYK